MVGCVKPTDHYKIRWLDHYNSQWPRSGRLRYNCQHIVVVVVVGSCLIMQAFCCQWITAMLQCTMYSSSLIFQDNFLEMCQRVSHKNITSYKFCQPVIFLLFTNSADFPPIRATQHSLSFSFSLNL